LSLFKKSGMCRKIGTIRDQNIRRLMDIKLTDFSLVNYWLGALGISLSIRVTPLASSKQVFLSRCG
jgi:hypothetical protein